MTAVHSPTAAGSGASASASFRSTAREGLTVPPERVSTVVTAVLQGVHEAIRANDVTYPEFQAAKQWLMDLGEGGEWPLFLDVFVEHVVEEVAARTQDGTKGSILGPYYLPDQQRLPAVATLPMRPDEQGAPLTFSGRVADLAGLPLAGAELDIWHADSEGYYSGFAPGIPDGNLRGVVTTDSEGRFEITTVQPAPYRIPTDGPTGRLIDAAGWHPWRPAHLHLVVRAPGHRPITTQLYFAGGEYVDSDVAEAVKPELVLTPAGQRVEYDFVLEPA
ncbi:dioxygenase [Lentzea sp. E54]|uniref:dioxygenase family protein n=1 Tax=Lentzea xerophila TaxID=3435883 RepID=UPI003DA57F74